ncbi:hypothetical protein F4781DRAFT_113612 [Annulohypoxylon bovei var. microspora]|nr:hypothetical protein F4781DRAFT_113612 [Annulohypoxylon bovei var. microspora]
MAEYAGLEPTDTFIDTPDILNDVDFDAPELNAEFFSFFESPESPPGQEPGPAKNEEVHEVALVSPPQYVDPRMLSNNYDTTANVAIQQQPLENHGTNYPITNSVTNPTNGNPGFNLPYPPMSNFAPPIDFPQNTFQYQYLPPTNPPYLGHGAGYPVHNANPYPVYVMPYPQHEPIYPIAEPTYMVPEAPYPTAQPIAHPVSNDLQPQDPLPMRVHNSFDSSSVDPKTFESRRSKVPSPIIIYREPPLKRPAKGPNGESFKNDRIPRVTRKNQPRPDPREWYGPPLSPPESWGPKDKAGRPMFKYTEYGELERGKTYSQKEMRWYIYGPKVNEDFELPKPLPNVPEVQGKYRQGLTIWIGWVAPQSNERYPHGSQSQRCRFADCPDPNHTIRTGFPRVIFDERTNVDGEAIDPFHNAGYAHLFCFEKHFDLVQAFYHLDIRPDERDFKREENLGKLSRQFPEIRNELDDWWREQVPMYQKYGKNRDRSYEQSLSYRLICHTLDHTSEGRVRMRESRAGADMSKHKGNLVEQRFLKDCMNEGLVDENGDAVPGAKELLTEFKTKGKKRRRKIGLKRLGTPSHPVPVGLHTDRSQPTSAHTHGFSPIGEFIPMPHPSPTFFPGSYDVLSPSALDFNQTTAAEMYQQELAQHHLSCKRDRHETLSEGQQSPDIYNPEQVQEPSAKRQRLSTQESPEPSPPTEQVPPLHVASQQPQIGGENESPIEEDGLPRCFPPLDLDLDHDDEVELDDNAVFDMIDEDMPSGKSCGSNIDKAPEPKIESPDDQDLGERDSLFSESDEPGDTEQHPHEEEAPG